MGRWTSKRKKSERAAVSDGDKPVSVSQFRSAFERGINPAVAEGRAGTSPTDKARPFEFGRQWMPQLVQHEPQVAATMPPPCYRWE